MDKSYPFPPATVDGDGKVFHPLDAVEVELYGLISASSSATWKMNIRRLDKFLENYPEPTKFTMDQLNLDDSLTVPEVLFSMKTYEYCGFTSTVASNFWSLYQENKCKFPGRNKQLLALPAENEVGLLMLQLNTEKLLESLYRPMSNLPTYVLRLLNSHSSTTINVEPASFDILEFDDPDDRDYFLSFPVAHIDNVLEPSDSGDE